MLILFALCSVLNFIPCGQTSMRCLEVLGVGFVCGSGGLTYYNVKSNDGSLYIELLGPSSKSSSFINPYAPVFYTIGSHNKLGLRQRKMSEFAKLLLGQIVDSQTHLGGFDFHGNTIKSDYVIIVNINNDDLRWIVPVSPKTPPEDPKASPEA